MTTQNYLNVSGDLMKVPSGAMTTKPPIKLCKTCDYKSKGFATWLLSHPMCERPNREIDPVTGEPEETFCAIQRRDYTYTVTCGAEGKFHSDNFKTAEPE